MYTQAVYTGLVCWQLTLLLLSGQDPRLWTSACVLQTSTNQMAGTLVVHAHLIHPLKEKQVREAGVYLIVCVLPRTFSGL